MLSPNLAMLANHDFFGQVLSGQECQRFFSFFLSFFLFVLGMEEQTQKKIKERVGGDTASD